ncbi:glycosyltransferase family 4 protein [Enhygromyxa salina]|uniref:glycosyltransferase family 4 protein n=1 Tax=Enhygromyxa salina TaxID=215803 RepID=UPI0015E7C669|nr:glycosyltransferase family 4 protein [Enhygromyxa salina]
MKPERDPAAGPRRRVAFVITRSDSIGGAQLHVLELARALGQAGHAVAVFVGGDGPFISRLREAGVSVWPIADLVREIDPAAELRALAQLRTAMRAFNPDLITAHSTKAGWLARVIGSAMRIPVLFTVHGWLFTSGKLSARQQVARLAELGTGPLADRLMAVSEHDKQIGVEHGIAQASGFSVVHNSLPDNPDTLRADPSRSPPRLVMVARFDYPKDPITLIHALAQLRELAWTCELIGDGPDRPQVEAALRETGLESRIELLGTRDDVPERLAAAQVFLLSSMREGFPISILEAMRAGLPVVASDVGGIAEAVLDGETGKLVAPAAVPELAAALAPLLGDSELRRRWGQAGRRRFVSEFGFETHVRRAWAVYAEVIERGSKSLPAKLWSRLSARS